MYRTKHFILPWEDIKEVKYSIVQRVGEQEIFRKANANGEIVNIENRKYVKVYYECLPGSVVEVEIKVIFKSGEIRKILGRGEIV